MTDEERAAREAAQALGDKSICLACLGPVPPGRYNDAAPVYPCAYWIQDATRSALCSRRGCLCDGCASIRFTMGTTLCREHYLEAVKRKGG